MLMFIIAVLLALGFICFVGVDLVVRVCVKCVLPVLNLISKFALNGALLMTIALIALVVFSALDRFQSEDMIYNGEKGFKLGLLPLIIVSLMGFCYVVVIMGYIARKGGWFKVPEFEDAELEQIQAELAALNAKKRKPIWKRILHFITRKHAYKDMISKIHQRANETKITEIIAWVPEKTEIVESIPMKEKDLEKGRG